MRSTYNPTSFFSRLVVICLCLFGSLPQTRGGSGVVNSDGTIDITLSLRFPPTADDLTDIRQQCLDASHVLWDASEGQLRFGTITISCGAVNEDLADMWFFPQSGRAGTGFSCSGASLATPGAHVTQFLPSSSGLVIAHEFGHLALGLGDEYSEQSRFGACWGVGRCIEAGDLTDQNNCLMQMTAGFDTEFCTPAGHDTVMGDGIDCATQPVPHTCADNCEFYNHTTDLYETTQETAVCNANGCWDHLVNNFSFLAAPAGLPAAAESGGFVAPTFVEMCDATDTVLLVLDTSNSMNWSVNGFFVEICDNGTDDDGDGMVDEAACTQSRLSYMKAAARGWLQLASGQNVRAGVITFDCNVYPEAGFQEVDGTTLGNLLNTVDNLTASGGTAIGRALSSTNLLFGLESGSLNKTAFLISDGHNTCGEDPSAVTPSLNSAGIRVFTISTGAASDESVLSEISGETGGARVDAGDGRSLVNAFVRQWARYRNGGVLIPILPYQLERNSNFSESPGEVDHSGKDWIDGVRLVRKPIPRNNFFEVEVEEGTGQVVVALAGDLNNMAQFGVTAKLHGPAGPNPSSFDSEIPDPLTRVVKDSFFLLFELRDPNPGTWFVEVQAAPGASLSQTGNVTVISDNPRADLFTSLSRNVLANPAAKATLEVLPYFDTALQGLDLLEANLVRPDGSVVAIPLSEQAETNSGYQGIIAGLTPFQGLYEVRVRMKTGPLTYNFEGEAIFSDAPSNSVLVPVFERTSTEYLWVVDGAKVCRSGNPADCDGDGIFGESDTQDTDNDGLPDGCDTDADDDGIPDRVEWRGQPTDMDRDGIPDFLDPDADGDLIRDDEDPNIFPGVPTHEVRVPDGVIGPNCSGEQTIYVRLSTEEAVKGFTLGMKWSELLEIVEIKPGPDVPEKEIFFFVPNVEDANRGLLRGEALVGLALSAQNPKAVIGPGRDLRVLQLRVRARPGAKPGSRVTICFEDGLGNPPQNTILSVPRRGTTVSVSPDTRCGALTVSGDRTPPTIRCPADIVIRCGNPKGEVVVYQVDAKDACSPVEVQCFPPSGSLFPPGVTVVTCRAVDESGNVSYCHFRVVVGANRPPQIKCPDDIVITCGSPNGSFVDYNVEATDDCGAVTVKCEPPSGSFFPPGTTTVVCTATDESGNTSRCVFNVKVAGGECFRRGDSNTDGLVDITDGINTLAHLFLGTAELNCPDSADFDDSGVVDITDSISTFVALFIGGKPAPPPGSKQCGADPTADKLPPCKLDCK